MTGNKQKNRIFRAVALCLAFVLLSASAAVGIPASAAGDPSDGNSVAENLGNISDCSYDAKTGNVTVTGTVYHKLFSAAKYSQLALYRVLPWEKAEEVIASAEPLARSAMSMRFSFTVSCPSVAQRVCMFAVAAVAEDGSAVLLTAPKYYSAGGASPSSLGFKGVSTPNDSDAIDSGAGTTVVDVFLDRLESSRHSGFIFRNDGRNFYLDRDYIDELDTVIRSYYASGADVLIRLLVSAQGKDVSFAPFSAYGARYRGIVIDGAESLSAVYAYTYFLASRYASSEYGKISGIILGRAADEPEKFGFTGLTGNAHADNCATVLSVIGAALDDALGKNGIALIVPVGDAMDAAYSCGFEPFLERLGGILSARTELSIGVMLESTHNPYGIYDDFFYEEPEDGEDTGEESGDEPALPFAETEAETTESAEMQTAEEITVPESAAPEGSGEETEAPEETTAGQPEESAEEPTEPEEPEPTPAPVPEMNSPLAGFVCSDTIAYFDLAFSRVRAGRSCFAPGYIFCWYPDAETRGSALSVCFAYNYLKLATNRVSCFIVSFDDVGDDIFYRIGHLFRSISSDEVSNNELTSYARSVFDVDDWGKIISGYSDSNGVYEKNTIVTLRTEAPDIRGSYSFWNFSERSGTQGWYAGFRCSTLKSVSMNGSRYLSAHIYDARPEESGGGVSFGTNYADIGFIFDTNEPLLDYDDLSFCLRAGEDDGSLFEIKIVVYSDKMKIEGSSVISAGKTMTLYLDTASFPEGVKPHAIRLCVRHINNSGNYDLNVYNISVNSRVYSSGTLATRVEAARSEIRTNEKTDAAKRSPVALGVLALVSAVGVSVGVPTFLERRAKRKKNGLD